MRGAAGQKREITFFDQQSGTALRLQIEPDAADPGGFAFRAPDRGSYIGHAGMAMQVNSPTDIVVNYQGPATLQPDFAVDDPPINGAATVVASVSLQAHVDGEHHTAQATLIEGGVRFDLLRLPVPLPEVIPALSAVETATLQADWATVYNYMNSDITRSNSPPTFAAQMSQGDAALGPIIALRRLAVDDAQTDDQGATAIAVHHEVDRSAGGGTSTGIYDAHDLLQQRNGKVWYTDAR